MAWAADGAAPLPDRVFTRGTLVAYLDHGRPKMRARLADVTDAELSTRCPANHPHAGKTLLELLHVNLAHVREHGGPIDRFLRESGIEP